MKKYDKNELAKLFKIIPLSVTRLNDFELGKRGFKRLKKTSKNPKIGFQYAKLSAKEKLAIIDQIEEQSENKELTAELKKVQIKKIEQQLLEGKNKIESEFLEELKQIISESLIDAKKQIRKLNLNEKQLKQLKAIFEKSVLKINKIKGQK